MPSATRTVYVGAYTSGESEVCNLREKLGREVNDNGVFSPVGHT